MAVAPCGSEADWISTDDSNPVGGPPNNNRRETVPATAIMPLSPTPSVVSMRVCLASGGFRTPERVAALASAMRSHFGGIRELLFVPFALADHDGYVRTMTDRGL